jgi:hypothetical protein
MTAMPQAAMAEPCRSGGLMLSSTVWESGTSAAPKTPCSQRKITISVTDCAMPQSMEATVNPTTDTMKSRFKPMRAVRNPVSGVAMAAATM